MFQVSLLRYVSNYEKEFTVRKFDNEIRASEYFCDYVDDNETEELKLYEQAANGQFKLKERYYNPDAYVSSTYFI